MVPWETRLEVRAELAEETAISTTAEFARCNMYPVDVINLADFAILALNFTG